MAKDSTPFREIAVRAPNWIGDHILAVDFYRGLRAHFPEAKITLLALPPIAELKDLGFGQRVFDHVSVLDRRQPPRDPFDISLSLPASVSSAWYLFRMRSRIRLGFAETLARPFYTRSLAWRGRARGLHKRDLYSELLSILPNPGQKSVPFVPPARPPVRERTIVVAPSASIELREWPYYPELLGALRERYPEYSVQVVGTEQEGARWRPKFKRENYEDRFGATSLPQLLELCRGASLVIANDSGTAHLAASLAQAPTLVLFGPGDPAYVVPKGPAVRGVRVSDLPCSPCESARCRAPFGYQACLRRLDLATVLSEVERMF